MFIIFGIKKTQQYVLFPFMFLSYRSHAYWVVGNAPISLYTSTGALNGGSPMSHVDFKKTAMSPVAIIRISLSILK